MAAPDVAREIDLAALDATLDAAIERGGPAGLRVLGFGEITLVLGWPPERRVLAVKRLPVFGDAAAAAERYAALVEEYLAAVRARGVEVAWPRRRGGSPHPQHRGAADRVFGSHPQR